MFSFPLQPLDETPATLIPANCRRPWETRIRRDLQIHDSPRRQASPTLPLTAQLISFRRLFGSIDQYLGGGSIPGVLSHLEKHNDFK